MRQPSSASASASAFCLSGALLCTVLAAGCRDQRVVTPPELLPVDEAAAAELAQRLLTEEFTPDQAADLVDAEAMLQLGGAGLMLPRGFQKGAIASIQDAQRHPVSGIPAQLQATGTTRLLANRVVDGERWLSFGIADPEGGYEQFSLRLAKRRGGQVHVVDTMLLTTSERATAQLRRYMLSLGAKTAVRAVTSPFAKATLDYESELAKHLDDYIALHNAVRDEQWSEALAAYARLPAGLQKTKFALLLRINAASNLDDASYLRAIEDLRTHHAEDPATQVALIDYYTLHEKWDEAIGAVDAVARFSVPDPYWLVLKGQLQYAADRMDAAHQTFVAAWRALPDMPDPAAQLADIYVERGAHGAQADALIELIRHHGFAVTDLEEFEGYEAFLRSADARRLKAVVNADEARRRPPGSVEVVARTGVKRADGWLYYIDKNGDVARTRMSRNAGAENKKAPSHQVVKKAGVQREQGWLYYLDADGHIARSRMVRGGDIADLSAPQPAATFLAQAGAKLAPARFPDAAAARAFVKTLHDAGAGEVRVDGVLAGAQPAVADSLWVLLPDEAKARAGLLQLCTKERPAGPRCKDEGQDRLFFWWANPNGAHPNGAHPDGTNP